MGHIKTQEFMDYIHLKKTLIAVFDHFLSCHDRTELEEMMQVFEAGKSLVITLPEAVHRDDYAGEIETMMAVEKPKKIASRIRKKKPNIAVKQDIQQVKICDVPILLDLAKLPKEKRQIVKDTLNGEHQVTLHDVQMNEIHGFAKARIFKIVKDVKFGISPREMLRSAQHDSSFSQIGFSADERKIFEKIEKSGGDYGKDIVKNMILEIKKYRDPP